MDVVNDRRGLDLLLREARLLRVREAAWERNQNEKPDQREKAAIRLHHSSARLSRSPNRTYGGGDDVRSPPALGRHEMRVLFTSMRVPSHFLLLAPFIDEVTDCVDSWRSDDSSAETEFKCARLQSDFEGCV